MSNNQWHAPNQPPGRDPRQPFGAPPRQAPPAQIQDFEDPRGRPGRTVVLAVGAVVLVAGILLGLQFLGSDDPEATDPPSRPAPSATWSSLGAGATSVPFDGRSTGLFELVSHSWQGSQLRVTVRIRLDKGDGRLSLVLYNNELLEQYSPIESDPLLLKPGETAEVTATFDAPADRSTLILASNSGSAITALELTP